MAELLKTTMIGFAALCCITILLILLDDWLE